MPAPSLDLTTSYQTLATGATDGTAVLSMVFTNYSVGTETINIHVVPNAGSVLDANTIIKSESILASDTFIWDTKILLGVGETIQVQSSANTSISSVVSYLDL